MGVHSMGDVDRACFLASAEESPAEHPLVGHLDALMAVGRGHVGNGHLVDSRKLASYCYSGVLAEDLVPLHMYRGKKGDDPHQRQGRFA